MSATRRGIRKDKNIILKYHFGTLDLSNNSDISAIISRNPKMGDIITVINVAKYGLNNQNRQYIMTWIRLISTIPSDLRKLNILISNYNSYSCVI